MICPFEYFSAKPTKCRLVGGRGSTCAMILEAEKAVAGEPPDHTAKELSFQKADLL